MSEAVAMRLETGKTYRAKIEIPWFASKDAAKRRLIAAGFSAVIVYEANGDVLAQGTWPGPSQDVDLPPQVKQVWEV